MPLGTALGNMEVWAWKRRGGLAEIDRFFELVSRGQQTRTRNTHIHLVLPRFWSLHWGNSIIRLPRGVPRLSPSPMPLVY